MMDCNEWANEWAPGTLVELPVVSAFLLIQNGKLLDVSTDPSKLNFAILNEFNDWQVFAGARNEFKRCEILGPVARVWCNGGYSKFTVHTTYHETDNSASFTATTLPSAVIKDELRRLYRMRALLDPCSLGLVKLFAS
jgi:hypothetical protein